MSKRKTPYQKQLFESTGASGDTSANIYMSMLLSPAWMDLTAQQQRLYLICKAQYYAEKVKPNGDRRCFTMNQSKWADLYQIYKRNNAAGFYRDMESLILHGFVACVECGRYTRTKSVYRFSSDWQQWGTEGFEIAPAFKTSSMLKKERETAEK